MKVVEIKGSEERDLWRLRQNELRLHKLDRKNYYPFNIDKWEEKNKEIVYKYNILIQESNKIRKETEEEYNLIEEKLKDEQKQKRAEQKRAKQELAEQKRAEQKRNREELTEEYTNNPRRSHRISKMLKEKENIAVEALLALSKR
tara:strand:- start:3936 stop:4370 length:435 start_codon:yes stop_codon:yes gene_type:complete